MNTVAVESKYEVVLGLEVHVQLNTASKLFSTAANAFGAEPNQNTAVVCHALPGALPVLNGKAVESAIRVGLGLGCEIARYTKFDRKQYFYPDLPKAYQISQYDFPICGPGEVTLSNGRVVRILRAHLEEDAGKLVHVGSTGLDGSTHSLVDFNRAGSPLVEIVSEPDMRSAQEAKEYMMMIRNLVRYLGVCDGNLEEGSMRCDANVSVRPWGQAEYGTKAEIKNMNSFRSIERAIEAEVLRQVAIVEAGGTVIQESRLWNEAKGETVSMRSKEEAHDYRYFPDPDIAPLHIEEAWIQRLRESQPELPQERYERLVKDFDLSEYDAHVLTEFKDMGDFFLSAAALSAEYKLIANYLQGDITGVLKNEKLTLGETALSAEALAELATLTAEKTVSSATAKKLIPVLLKDGGLPSTWIERLGLKQLDNVDALTPIIADILAQNPDNVAAYQAGKDKLFGFFVGQAMKATQGRANPETLNRLIKEALDATD
jgi:aspartyl-tRNA(Asn)/glutamyl-tRNA(Gln) amidotransferase subunit B